MTATPSVIERWHRVVKAKNMAELDELLADQVVFQSPAVHSPQVGKTITKKYLEAALKVLDGGAFRYVGEWYAENSAVLEFETSIDGVQINGVDIIHWNAAGRIVRFKVMIRPMKALQTIVPLMAGELQRGATP
jgi:hypothetical protein